MSDSPPKLEMSVLLVTPDNFATIRPTVRHLRAQTIRDRLELFIIAPSRAQLQIDDAEVAGFGGLRVVEVGPIQSASAAKATTLAHVTTPYVVFAEGHSYPEPNWAETLLAAHRAGHTIVGPVVENANPATALSWANFIACFGRWTGPLPTGAICWSDLARRCRGCWQSSISRRTTCERRDINRTSPPQRARATSISSASGRG